MEIIVDGVSVDAALSDEEKFCRVWTHYWQRLRVRGLEWSNWQSDIWERFTDEQRQRISKRLEWAKHANLSNLSFME